MSRKSELELNFKEIDGRQEFVAAHSWLGVTVSYSRLHLPAAYDFHWDGQTHYLAHHDLILEDGELLVTGEPAVPGGDLRDRMTYTPAGCAIDGWAKPADRLNAFTVVSFDPSAMEAELQKEINGTEARPHIYFTDEGLGATMRRLGHLMTGIDGPVSRLHAETVGLGAALEMFQLSRETRPRLSGAGQLTAQQLRLVQAFVEDHLDKDIALDDLAALCGLTRFHFSRAFKASTGEPPYRYVTLRRIERARKLLAETGWPISAIATACGFNGSSQFARAFRELHGETPQQFRRRV